MALKDEASLGVVGGTRFSKWHLSNLIPLAAWFKQSFPTVCFIGLPVSIFEAVLAPEIDRASGVLRVRFQGRLSLPEYRRFSGVCVHLASVMWSRLLP